MFKPLHSKSIVRSDSHFQTIQTHIFTSVFHIFTSVYTSFSHQFSIQTHFPYVFHRFSTFSLHLGNVEHWVSIPKVPPQSPPGRCDEWRQHAAGPALYRWVSGVLKMVYEGWKKKHVISIVYHYHPPNWQQLISLMSLMMKMMMKITHV